VTADKRSELLKLLTGIHGLDALLGGGLQLPKSGDGLVLLIRGAPGTGKTTLALQFLNAAASWAGISERERCYMTFEQDEKDICEKIAGLCPPVPKGACPVLLYGRGSTKTAFENDETAPLSGVNPVLHRVLGATAWLSKRRLSEDDSEKKRLRFMAIDGLNLLGPKEQEVAEIERLVRIMRSECRVGVLVHESGGECYSSLDYQCDTVIELRGQTQEFARVHYFLTDLAILKSRFQQSALGWHQYKTHDDGLIVFPSVHFLLHKHKSLADRLEDSKSPITEVEDVSPRHAVARRDKSFITQLLGRDQDGRHNLKAGSCTVLLGPRRCLKTQITFDFLRAGSILASPEPGLLASLIDNQGTIVGQRSCLCERDCKGRMAEGNGPGDCDNTPCYQHVHLLHFPPGCITANEFFSCLEERLRFQEAQGKAFRRFVFWDLAQLEYRFPLLYRDPMFLPGLMDYLKYSRSSEKRGRERQITSLFMGASNTEIARSASAMADNVLFCWQDERLSDRKRGIAVYVDRIEGHPGENDLFFTVDPSLPAARSVAATSDSRPNLDFGSLNDTDLLGGEDMIAEIKKLQGLPAQKKARPAEPVQDPHHRETSHSET